MMQKTKPLKNVYYTQWLQHISILFPGSWHVCICLKGKLVLWWRGHWLPSIKDKVTFLWRRIESCETHCGLWVYWTRSSHLFAGTYTIISLMLYLSQCVTFLVIDLFGIFSSHCWQWNHQHTFVARRSDLAATGAVAPTDRFNWQIVFTHNLLRACLSNEVCACFFWWGKYFLKCRYC